MTRLALVSLADNAIVAAPLSEGGWIDLPNGARVSPAQAGWQGDDDHPYRLVAITDFFVPDGKQISGPATYAVDGDTATESFPVEDIPAVRRPVLKTVILDRLNAAGLLAAASAALEAPASLYSKTRWYTPGFDYVYADDQTTLALLAFIGADPSVVLAP